MPVPHARAAVSSLLVILADITDPRDPRGVRHPLVAVLGKTYETLLGRGVEFTEEPTDRPYGTDCGLRDPFGNHLRFTQPKA